MTDLITGNGVRDAQDVNGSTVDVVDDGNEHEAAAQLHERARTKHEARKRDLNRRIDALLDERALVVAEIARCNRLIAIERSDVKVRGRKKTAPTKTNGRK